MRLEHSFTVPAPVEQAWDILLDLPRVAPCMPGATLTGVDGDAFTGTVKVKLGPITLTYQGKGHFVERDEAAHRAVVQASGKDSRSAGTATATVTAVLVGQDSGTRVNVETDLTVTGRPAQFGRGMIAEVGGKLIGQFADCLARTLGGGTAPPATTEPAAEAAPGVGSAASVPAADPVGAREPATAFRTVAANGPAEWASAVAPAVRPADRVRPPLPEAEPVDLLRLTGGTAVGRRLLRVGVGVGLAAAAFGVIAWAVTRRSAAG